MKTNKQLIQEIKSKLDKKMTVKQIKREALEQYNEGLNNCSWFGVKKVGIDE